MVQHCTPEQLALAALREPLPADDDAHLAGCARCLAEVATLQRSVNALAVPELAAPGRPVAPPPAVWAGIAAATGVSTAPRPALSVATPPPTSERSATAQESPVVPLRREPNRRWRMLLAAAAALIIGVGIGAGVVALRSGEGGGTPVAATALEPVGDDGATGSASVVRRGDARVLEVSVDAPAPANGYYEVWLAQPDLQHMVAVGVLHDGAATLDLPDGIDVTSYSFVDVSLEPLDGDPAHSAVSVARGQLEQ